MACTAMPRSPARGVWFLRANGFENAQANTSDAKFIEAFRGFFPHMMAPADLLRWWAPVPECGDSNLAKMRRSGIHIVEPAQARQRLAAATDETTYNNTDEEEKRTKDEEEEEEKRKGRE